ncbi:MAG: glycoside hydrolase family 13 protein [Peptococcaceae bacterium]
MANEWIYFNSHDLAYRKPFGAVTCGEKIDFRLRVSGDKIEKVLLKIWGTAVEEQELTLDYAQQDGGAVMYKGELHCPMSPGLIWYYFIVVKDQTTYFFGNNEKNLGGVGKIYDRSPSAYQITVYQENNAAPRWFKEGIVYQIFVDRFYKSCGAGKFLNPKPKSLLHGSWDDTPFYLKDEEGRIIQWDFFGGNLRGIMEKLPYLQELGINILYLNPIFESSSNHKYDTSDYLKIDAMFGTNEDFAELCRKAGRLGISIILDGVFSHTGSDSIYFDKDGKYPTPGACRGEESPYYKWYRFNEHPHTYECWWGIDSLPNVNELEASYLDFIIYNENSVIKYWMQQGAKGWRLDVADELPDEFIKKLRKTMKKFDPRSVLIGEVWEDASRKISYEKLREYFWGQELDGVMNYPLRNIFIQYIMGGSDAYDTYLALMSLYENYPRPNFYSNLSLIGSHDVPRILTILGEALPAHELPETQKRNYRLSPEQKLKGVKRLKLLALLQMTFPGVPCIYYGDEVGLEGYGDPYNRGPYPWNHENEELLQWYKKIIALRNKYEALQNGGWQTLYAQGDILAFTRYSEGQQVFIILNRNSEERISFSLDFKQWLPAGDLQDLLQEGRISAANGILTLSLEPLTGKVLLKNQ